MARFSAARLSAPKFTCARESVDDFPPDLRRFPRFPWLAPVPAALRTAASPTPALRASAFRASAFRTSAARWLPFFWLPFLGLPEAPGRSGAAGAGPLADAEGLDLRGSCGALTPPFSQSNATEPNLFSYTAPRARTLATKSCGKRGGKQGEKHLRPHAQNRRSHTQKEAVL